MPKIRLLFWIVCLLSFGLPAVHASGPPWRFVQSKDRMLVSFGFLVQPQFESLEYPTGYGSAYGVFFRRFRLMAGGRIGPKLSFFIESDSTNLGKKGANGKRIADIFLQDAYLNYAFRPEFQIDGGMLLPFVSRNSGQSTASLLPIDYGPYSFLASDPTHSKIGRDYGVQARGYIQKHLEYRFGVYRGNTNHDGAFPYRYLARIVWYPFEADTGMFYIGSTLGQKKIVGIGTSFDRQGNYSANSVDVFVDYPIRGGDAVTAQANFIRYDGGTTFPSLARQNTWLIEGSYFLRGVKLGPFVQFASRDYADPETSGEKKVQTGVTYWFLKQKVNIKAGVGQLLKADAPARTQFVIQTQFYYY